MVPQFVELYRFLYDFVRKVLMLINMLMNLYAIVWFAFELNIVSNPISCICNVL